MSNTGRIKRQLDQEMQNIVFPIPDERKLAEELNYIAQVDLAHLSMLVSCSLLSEREAALLIKEIVQLKEENFQPLKDKKPVRGLYLLYENYLVDQVGPRIAGMLQAGRSRNDLTATISKIRTRPIFLSLAKNALALVETLEEKSRVYSSIVMPAYTHYQPAMPITFGHYLESIAEAILRDTEYFIQTVHTLDQSPLGAGAGGGTSFEIQPDQTARLLGFGSTANNSIDAVSNRDHILRMLSTASILGLSISRCAADLMLWSTHEFGFIYLPDELVGSSSMMPQKRNPFLLEHVKGKSGAALACFQYASMATHAVPYGNSVAVGTESVRGFEEAMNEIIACLAILKKHIELLSPQPSRMEAVANAACTSATFIAETLVRESEISFRQAHHAVGEKISEAEERGYPGAMHAAQSVLTMFEPPVRTEMALAALAMKSAAFGFGPGKAAQSDNQIQQRCRSQYQLIEHFSERWETAQETLHAEVKRRLSHFEDHILD